MSTTDELVKLQGLKDAGTLSEAEFQQAKAKVLSETSPAQQPPTPPPTSSPALVKAPGVVLHKKDVIFLIKRIERCLPYMNEQENKVQTKNLEFFRSTLERNKKVRGNWHTKQPIPGITETRALLSRIETANRLAVGTEPKSSKSTKAPRTSRLSRRGRWSLAIVLVVLIAIIVAVSGHSSTPPTQAQEVAAFNGFVSTVNQDLSVCTAGASDMQVEVGLLEQNPSSVSQSDLATLDTDSKTAQGYCDQAQNNDILNLGAMSVPGALSSLSSLQSFPIDANNWATSDTTAVLHDIQNIAESNGSAVADESQLQTDTATADQDASALNSALAQAAQQLGVKTPSIGLVSWGTGSGS
jgi:cell wall-associated NlpC family hydrolase